MLHFCVGNGTHAARVPIFRQFKLEQLTISSSPLKPAPTSGQAERDKEAETVREKETSGSYSAREKDRETVREKETERQYERKKQETLKRN